MTMTVRMKVALTAVALGAAMLAASAPASAERGQHRGQDDAANTVVFTLDDSTHGNPEGVTSDGRFFFVGATGDGTIYRGTLGDATVHTFIPGVAGRSSVGMKTFRGRLYVAGGTTGQINVFDLSDPSAAPITFDTGAGGFLNDLVVTGKGDIFVTDSFRPMLWHIAADQVKPGGAVDAISVAPEIPFAGGGAFNLNGIVAFRGGRELLVDNTTDGNLYRIRFDASGGRTITRVDAPALVGADGMLVDAGRLIVVRGAPASLTFLKLKSDRSRAEIRDVRTDPTLRGPSTVARDHNRYLVVNADFATSTQPFTVSGLERARD
jgi:sugar lactone lactonase YvrE